jgi:WD40 repeat protein
MLRWLGFTVVLVVGVFVLLDFLAGDFRASQVSRMGNSTSGLISTGSAGPRLEQRDHLSFIDNGSTRGVPAQPLIVQEARVLPTTRIDVPSETDGKIVCLATTIQPGEEVSEDKIVGADLGFLAVEVRPDDDEESHAAVTSVQFAADRLLLSAGDTRVLAWNLENHSSIPVEEFDRRSGRVGLPGVSPDGKEILFDEQRDLLMLSLHEHKIDGDLQNPSGAADFSTFSLFSPDGTTILTNSSAPGRLQLWRTPSAQTGRSSELREFVWTNGLVTCGGFAPRGSFAVTGTDDHQVLVWDLPGQDEIRSTLTARLCYVEEFLDCSRRRVAIRAEMKKPAWVIPGGTATMVVPQPLWRRSETPGL